MISSVKGMTVNATIILALVALLVTSCSKLIEVDTPTTSISAANVYTNDLTAAAVLTGIYTTMSASYITGNDLPSIGLISGLSGDELVLYSGSGNIRLRAYYQNNLKTVTAYTDFWTIIYQKVYILNLSLEGLTNATTLTYNVKQQLLGEVKFLRAFCYFYLVNLYGDVPLILSSDYKVNKVLPRSPKEQVWKQIIADLVDAKALLSADYLDGTLMKKTTERIRPNKWAATALLARCYLYNRDWKNAENQASEVISNLATYSLDSLNKAFLIPSHEAIWQLQPVNLGSNTEDAKTYILTSAGPSYDRPVYLSSQLINSFEENDQRRKLWIDTVTASGILYYYANKYKSGTLDAPLTEYNTVLRVAEQYLIRAEARAELNDIDESRGDLNIIRLRAGLKESSISEKTLLIDAIRHERRVELFTEWGHRWLDMKRTNTIDEIMPPITTLKGGTWDVDWQYFPILPSDILVNGNLTQNAGY